MSDSSALFPPLRRAGLDRLAQFAPRAGHHYAAGRNTDAGPGQPGGVSQLSPYLRYRMVTEAEVVAAVLALHSAAAAEKFVQEVLWRTYWKGWLELHPEVWSRFEDERDRQQGELRDHRAIADAEAGATGIDGFDDWAHELVATGYLHNHARMWFASIWIFTLRLPWALGADFFLRHLVDADAASNTLSWRWVAGLQTVGKTYLATAENIARFTGGRFKPVGLATEALPLAEPPVAAARVLPQYRSPAPRITTLLLVTADDLHPESVVPRDADIAGIIVAADPALLWGDAARHFVREAAAETVARAAAHFGYPATVAASLDAALVIEAANAIGAQQVVAPYAPVGPTADAIARLAPQLAASDLSLATVRRDWDEAFWPHARKGFFPFRERIPALLREIGLQ